MDGKRRNQPRWQRLTQRVRGVAAHRRVRQALLAVAVLLLGLNTVLPAAGPALRAALAPQLAGCPLTRAAMLAYVADDWAAGNVTYYITFGTLLGAVRGGHVIPWTEDVDVALPGLRGTGGDAPLRRPAIARCFHVPPRDGHGTVRALLPRWHWAAERSAAWFMFWKPPVYVDVYATTPSHDTDDGSMTYFLHGTGTVSVAGDWIFPLGTATIDGRRFPAPRKPEPFLEAVYGSSWRRPDPDNHGPT
jgi:hypothetical protein